jgi:hypothetical protein
MSNQQTTALQLLTTYVLENNTALKHVEIDERIERIGLILGQLSFIP